VSPLAGARYNGGALYPPNTKNHCNMPMKHADEQTNTQPPYYAFILCQEPVPIVVACTRSVRLSAQQRCRRSGRRGKAHQTKCACTCAIRGTACTKKNSTTPH